MIENNVWLDGELCCGRVEQRSEPIFANNKTSTTLAQEPSKHS